MMVYGVAEQILTDQGSNFESERMHELMELLDIRKIRSSAGHAMGDGQSERMVRTMKEMIDAYVTMNTKTTGMRIWTNCFSRTIQQCIGVRKSHQWKKCFTERSKYRWTFSTKQLI
jgi:transposase InsO family protein